MASRILYIDTIISDPDIRNGQPMIVDTTIRVVDVVASHLYRGLTPEDIATQYKLTLGHVHSALAYYYVNKAEMDKLMQSEFDTAEHLLSQIDAQGKLIRLE